MLQTKDELIATWVATKSQREMAKIEAELAGRLGAGGTTAKKVAELLPRRRWSSASFVSRRASLWKIGQSIPLVMDTIWSDIDAGTLPIHAATDLVHMAKQKVAAHGGILAMVVRDGLDEYRRTQKTPKYVKAMKAAPRSEIGDIWAQIRTLVKRIPAAYDVDLEEDLTAARALQTFQADLNSVIEDVQRAFLAAQKREQENLSHVPDLPPSRQDVIRACQQLNADPPKMNVPFDKEGWSKVNSAKKATLRAYHPDLNKSEHAADFFEATKQAFALLQRYQDEMTTHKPQKTNFTVVK